MPRARNIKPSFFTNEVLGQEDPLVGLTFIGLWCLADRDGRLEDRPVRIKGELFPYRDKLDVNRYLTVLERTGHIERYEVDGKKYIQVVNFTKHQSPHHTEKSKNYPENNQQNHKHINGNNGYITVTPLDNGYPTVTTRPDSLIPDSLIPEENTMSGKPDDARDLLEFLNKVTGRRYEPVAANMTLIRTRLKEYGKDRLKAMVACKAEQWKYDEAMNRYLRPATLFNATMCAQYIAEVHA